MLPLPTIMTMELTPSSDTPQLSLAGLLQPLATTRLPDTSIWVLLCVQELGFRF